MITASVRLKARIVSADERDTGLRHVLNYGHTLAHALETETGFDLRHGEAVAIGTVFAGRLAGELGRIEGARVDEHLTVVRHYGLPWQLPPTADIDALTALMRLDKKAMDTAPGHSPSSSTARTAPNSYATSRDGRWRCVWPPCAAIGRHET